MACTYSDFCVSVNVDVENQAFAVDGGWMAGAFFLGLILGALVTALCSRPCVRDWEKKKRQDAEEGLGLTAIPVESVTAVPVVEDKGSTGDGGKTKKKGRGSRFKRSRKQKMAEGEEEGLTSITGVIVEPALCRGMVDIMAQTESVGAETELAEQDIDQVNLMEKECEEEKDQLELKTLDFLLRKLEKKGSLDRPFREEFIKKAEEEATVIRNMIDREKEEKEEELRKNSKLSKDTQTMENELLKIQTTFSNKLAQMQRKQREKLRLDLIRSSGLSEAEVEDVMEKLLKNMADVEEKIAQEQARQKRALEERLARRRQVMEYTDYQEQAASEDISRRVRIQEAVFDKLVADNKLMERQKEDLLQQYEQDLRELQDKHRQEARRQQEAVAEKLRARRRQKMQALAEKQTKTRLGFLSQADKSTQASEFIEGYHNVISVQHEQAEALNSELDQQEVQELDAITKQGLRSVETEADLRDKQLLQDLQSTASLHSQEANEILRINKQQAEILKARQQKEKEYMLQRLQERMAQRLQNLETEEHQDMVEQAKLREQQASTLRKALASNMDLTEEARERILREHDQNTLALNNRLQRSKMRQQKSLQMKLSQRRAALADIRRKQEEELNSKRKLRQEEREALQLKLEEQLQKEEERLEAERQAALADLRKQMAAETQLALQQQDEEIGLLIGRLQIGQARRQAILQKQDKTLEVLQDKLEERLSEGMPRVETEQLLQQHFNQVNHANERLQQTRDRQEQILMEKLQNKKMRRQHEIEQVLGEEAEEEYSLLQLRGAGNASQMMMRNLLEQRRKKALAELEQEMKAELETVKEQLNSEMESALESELQEQKQSFLHQLGALSNLSQKEINEAVSAAVAGSGKNEKSVKKLSKNLRQGMERAKTELEMDTSHTYNRPGLERTRTDLDRGRAFTGEEGPGLPLRGAKKKKRFGSGKPKRAFADDGDTYGYGEGDDDF